MKRKLMRSGNGWAMFLLKTILELLNLDPEKDMLEFEIEGKVLKITKAGKDNNLSC